MIFSFLFSVHFLYLSFNLLIFTQVFFVIVGQYFGLAFLIYSPTFSYSSLYEPFLFFFLFPPSITFACFCDYCLYILTVRYSFKLPNIFYCLQKIHYRLLPVTLNLRFFSSTICRLLVH